MDTFDWIRTTILVLAFVIFVYFSVNTIITDIEHRRFIKKWDELRQELKEKLDKL